MAQIGKHGGARIGAGRKPGVPNKTTAEVKALAQEFGPAAIAELARIAFKSQHAMARLSALKELLDRGYGKVPQAISGSPDDLPIRIEVVKRVIVDPLADVEEP